MEHSFGHSPACLQEFNVRRIMFLWVTNESIEHVRISHALFGVQYALKRVTRCECCDALRPWRSRGSPNRLAYMHSPCSTKLRPGRGAFWLIEPTLVGGMMT